MAYEYGDEIDEILWEWEKPKDLTTTLRELQESLDKASESCKDAERRRRIAKRHSELLRAGVILPSALGRHL